VPRRRCPIGVRGWSALNAGAERSTWAVLAALAVLEPDGHAAAVDAANFEGGHLAHPQPRAISCGLRAARLRSPGTACRKRTISSPLSTTGSFFGSLALRMRSSASGRAQRHAEEEAQCARHLVDVRPRPAEPGQVKLVGANLLDPQEIRRTAEKRLNLATA
jgi:hypothetical protein